MGNDPIIHSLNSDPAHVLLSPRRVTKSPRTRRSSFSSFRATGAHNAIDIEQSEAFDSHLNPNFHSNHSLVHLKLDTYLASSQHLEARRLSARLMPRSSWRQWLLLIFFFSVLYFFLGKMGSMPQLRGTKIDRTKVHHTLSVCCSASFFVMFLY
mgnify:FL=1